MPIKKEKRGTGMTERDTTVLSWPFGDDEWAVFNEAHRRHTFEEDGAPPIESWALEIIADAEITFHQGARARIKGKEVEDGDIVPDSQEDFALQLRYYLGEVRAALADGDAERAAYEGLRLGDVWREVKMKFKHEPAWQTGTKVRAAAERGGRRKGETADRDLRLAEEFKRRRPGSNKSDTALKAAIGRAEGLGRSTAIEAINRGLKIVSG